MATIAGTATAADQPTVLVLGDSLSAAYGIPLNTGWVHLLAERIERENLPYRVVNASITGDTSRGGLDRLPGLLNRYHPAVVILELGGNDGLQGLSPAQLAANLTAMVKRARADGARVLLIGMRMPPNYGPEFTERFAAVYREVANRLDVPLVPFLLAGVGGHPDLMQSDGIHAAAVAQPKLLDNVWPTLELLLKQAMAPSRVAADGATIPTSPAPAHSARTGPPTPPESSRAAD